ncbi:MAG: KTSC domain-containing protein [Spirochaetales bacterium]
MNSSTIPHAPARSSSLAVIGYSGDDNVLIVEFHSGALYCYLFVPTHEHEQLMRAQWLGRYFNLAIGSKYPHHRLEPSRWPT